MFEADKALAAFDGLRLLVVGDLMLDQYTWGQVERISPEAPVMVLEAQEEEVRLGGAASVASLLAGLNVSAAVAGVLGDDAAGRIVKRLLAERHNPALPSDGGMLSGSGAHADKRTANKKRRAADASCQESETPEAACRPMRRDLCLIDPTRPTTLKQRLLGQAANRYPHQILRLDRECRQPLDRTLEKRLMAFIGLDLPRCQAVLISDYAKGVCTPALVANVIHRSREARIPVLVDPARGADFSKYRGATLIKANRYEAQLALGVPILHRRHAFAAAREMCKQWDLEAAVITLDREGIVVATAEDACRHFDAQVREVCDVTGAGDTVLAVLGACLAAKMKLPQAVKLANIAAMLQVHKIGVGQITREELQQAASEVCPRHKAAGCESPSGTGAAIRCCSSKCRDKSPNKIVSVEQLFAWARDVRRRGQRIVFTNGCFDLLHVGHVTCLARAAELGDALVVAVNSDRSVRRLKGEGRPVIDETKRAAMVAALQAVDRVVVLQDDDPCQLLRELQPEVLAKGGGYRPDQVVGREIVEAYGGDVRLVEHVPGVSTTQIVESLHAS